MNKILLVVLFVVVLLWNCGCGVFDPSYQSAYHNSTGSHLIHHKHIPPSIWDKVPMPRSMSRKMYLDGSISLQAYNYHQRARGEAETFFHDGREIHKYPTRSWELNGFHYSHWLGSDFDARWIDD